MVLHWEMQNDINISGTDNPTKVEDVEEITTSGIVHKGKLYMMVTNKFKLKNWINTTLHMVYKAIT